MTTVGCAVGAALGLADGDEQITVDKKRNVRSSLSNGRKLDGVLDGRRTFSNLEAN